MVTPNDDKKDDGKKIEDEDIVDTDKTLKSRSTKLSENEGPKKDGESELNKEQEEKKTKNSDNN